MINYVDIFLEKLLYVADSLELLETIAENNVLLIKPITSGELKEVICHIKTGKSSYLDEIPNEA